MTTLSLTALRSNTEFKSLENRLAHFRLRYLGVVDSEKVRVAECNMVGAVTVTVAGTLAPSGSSTLFGQGASIHTGKYLRIGAAQRRTLVVAPKRFSSSSIGLA